MRPTVWYQTAEMIADDYGPARKYASAKRNGGRRKVAPSPRSSIGPVGRGWRMDNVTRTRDGSPDKRSKAVSPP